MARAASYRSSTMASVVARARCMAHARRVFVGAQAQQARAVVLRALAPALPHAHGRWLATSPRALQTPHDFWGEGYKGAKPYDKIPELGDEHRAKLVEIIGESEAGLAKKAIFRVIEEGELGAFFYSKVRVSRLLNDMRKENLLTMVYARRKNTLYTLNTAQELATDDEVADSDRAEAEVVQGA